MATLTKASAPAVFTSNDLVLMSASVEQIESRPGYGNTRGLVLLGHVIEHLSEQYVEFDGTPAEQDALRKAVHLLMNLHSALYAESASKGTETVRAPFWSRLLAG